MSVTIVPTLRADAVRDVCSRPAVLLALESAVPATAVRTRDDRSRAVADGILRALALAAEGAADRRGQLLLEEAAERLWDPVDSDLARVLRASGVEGLFAYLVVEGAVRREAWRTDTARRRAVEIEPLDDDVAAPVERDPVDLARFRGEVHAAAAITAERTGLDVHDALRLVASEVSYVDAARAANRSPNGLWMALSRLRPEWRGVAERGRAAGLGGGVLVSLADRSDRAVRRAIRWRLVGGLVAALLLAGATGAVIAASWLEGQTPPPRTAEPIDGGPTVSRVLPLTGVLGRAAPVDRVRPPARRAARIAPAPAASRTSSTPTPAPVVDAPRASCGLGSASLTCR